MYDINQQTGIDMGNARNTSTISMDVVRDFLFNGRTEWKKKKNVTNILANDPVFNKSGVEDMTRVECYERGIAISNRIYELRTIHGWSEQETGLALASLNEALPISLHEMAFKPVLLLQANPTILKKYQHLILQHAILGCYLQTELGHGTNVSRLETTATFILQSQEFEIHSPTLTSTKWWIGALGNTATHGVVQAKLILPTGEDVGPHLFFVQLRSLEDHKVLPGITIGDIGPKAMGGHAAVDHGFARFNHVRIPKENMLSRFAQVTDDGQYMQPLHAKMSYSGMLYIRSSMVTSGGWATARAATIAIRYATVRRQGSMGPDGLEKQTISYPSVYFRLLPILSRAYVFIQLGRTLISTFTKMTEDLKKGDASLLADIHTTTSGLKVYVSTSTANDIEVARRSMGGHGYSAFSGLGKLYADYLPATTFEGDNFVLDQQVVRASLKAYCQLFSVSEPSINSLSPFSFHLFHLIHRPAKSNHPISKDDWQNPTVAITLLERRAALMVHDHARNAGIPDASINQRLSNAVTEAFVAKRIEVFIGDLCELPEKDREVIRKVHILYLLTTTERGLADFLTFGLIPMVEVSIRSLRQTIDRVCMELVPESIGLTDAFGFTDWELDSALGRFDGKVYESLWECARAEPMNKREVADAYERSIKPMLQRGRRLAVAKDRCKL